MPVKILLFLQRGLYEGRAHAAIYGQYARCADASNNTLGETGQILQESYHNGTTKCFLGLINMEPFQIVHWVEPFKEPALFIFYTEFNLKCLIDSTWQFEQFGE